MSQFLMQTTTFVNDLAATPVWTSLGWTMWYYLWVGLIELAFAGLILTLLRRASSALRYRFLLGLFALLLVTPIIIFQYAYRETNAPLPGAPVVSTSPILHWTPSTNLPPQDFVQPDRMPNTLQPPWKPEASTPAITPRDSGPTILLLDPNSAASPAVSASQPPIVVLMQRLATFVPWLPILWIIGSPLTLLCLGFGLIGAERFRRQARIIPSGNIVDQCAQLAARIGLNGRILIGFSERISSPILIGILKPLILLPITAETGWPPAQLEMVLLHELAHVRRWDNLVNLLQRLAEGILFFQPAVWIVSRWLTAEREHCCDELVVRVTGRAHDYATALAELAMSEHLPPGVVSAMARHPLLGRIRRILGHEQPLQVSRTTLTIALIASLCFCALAGFVRGIDQSPKSETVPLEQIQAETSVEESDREISNPIPPEKSLDIKLQRAIATARFRTLIVGRHTPWQILQAIHGLKRDTVLITDTQPQQKVNAVEWLATAKTFQNEPLWEKTEFGARSHPFTIPFRFEGHPTQFLGILSACDLPLNYEFQTADGSPITVQDVLNDAKMRVEEGSELTWTLWALVHYLPIDASWKNSKGEDWSIERLVKNLVEADEKILSNEGKDALYVLAYARNQYLKTGKPLDGIWLKADEKLNAQIEKVKNQSSMEFWFSAGFVDDEKTARDFRPRRLFDGRSLGWLVMALSREQLEETWVRERVESLADHVYENRLKAADVAPFFSAINALLLYQNKTSSNPNPIPYPLTGNLAIENRSEVAESKSSNPTPADPAPDTFQKRWQILDVAGKPIEGVEVSAFAWDKSSPPETSNKPELRDPNKLIGKFVSDAEGKVQVQTPDDKPFVMELKKTGFMTLLQSSESWKRWIEDRDRPEFVPIELMRAGTITVEVRGAEDLPVSGVKIGCGNYFRSKSLADSNKYTNAVTDEKGRAVLTNLREGLVNLECSHHDSDQIKRTWSDCLLLADGAKLTIPVDLAQCNSSISGHVQDDLNRVVLSEIFVVVERAWDFNRAVKDLDEAARHRILDGMPTNQVAFPRDLLQLRRFLVIQKWKGNKIDAEGKFDIGKIPAGNYHLTFIHARTIDTAVNRIVPYNSDAGFQAATVEVHDRIAEKDIVLSANEILPIEVTSDDLKIEKKIQKDPVEPQPAPVPVEPNPTQFQQQGISIPLGKNADPPSKPVSTRNITFRIKTLLGRPLPGFIAEVYPQPELGKTLQPIPAEGASDHTGKLTITLPSEGIFDCTFLDRSSYDVATDQKQIPKSTAYVRVNPGKWNEGEEIPVIIGRPGRLRIGLSGPMTPSDPNSGHRSQPISFAVILKSPITGYGTASSVRGSLIDLTTKVTPRFDEIEKRLDGWGEVLIAYPRGNSAFHTYREVGHGIPRHLQSEPPLFSSKQENDSEPVLGLSWINAVPFVLEEDVQCRIDFNQCVCQIRGSVKNEKGEPLPNVEIRVNRHLPPLTKDGPLSRDREIPIPVWDNIPRSNDQGEFAIDRMQPGKVAIYAIQSDGKASETVYADLTTDKPVEANLVIDQSKPLPETPDFLLKAPQETPSTPIYENSPIPSAPQTAPSIPDSSIPRTNRPPVKLPPEQAATTPSLNLIEDANRPTREQLRYDGKSFEEWKNILHTEIKTERIAEAIKVITIFGSRGYEKTAVAEIADVLRRAPQTHVLRASMEFSQVMSSSAIALHLLGPAAIPELVTMLNSKDPHETITALELLSPPAEDPWNWPDSLPHPSTDGMSIGRIYENAGVVNGGVLGKGNAELLATLKSLLKHPNPEIRARVLPAAVGCQWSAAETREILSSILQDPDPAVWFSAMGMVNRPTPLKYPREALKVSYRKLKESGTIQSDPVRRNLYLRSILSDLSNKPPEETIQYIPDILDDLKATPIYRETAYSHLMELGIPASSEKALAFRDAVRKAAAELPSDQKTRVEETLNALDPEIDHRIKEAEERKTPSKS